MYWIGIGVAVVVVLGWLVWRARRGAASGGGPVSIVMLRSSPRLPTEGEVTEVARRCFRVKFEIKAMPMSDSHAVGYLILTEELPPLGLIASSKGYMAPEEAKELASRLEEPSVRAALMGHVAWLSIDAMGLGERDPSRLEVVYLLLGKLAAEFYDDECVLLYLPASERIALPSERAKTLLASDQIMDLFADDWLHAPVVEAKAGDRSMEAAMREARARFPEFVREFEGQGDAFVGGVKGAFTSGDGATEYMWIKVTRITSDGVEGVNMNNPVRPDLPKNGARVRVTLDKIADWICKDEKGEGMGAFLEPLLGRK